MTASVTSFRSRGFTDVARAHARLYIAAMHDEARLRKVRFRAWRRGFREADLILGPFADAHAAQMNAGDLDRFEALLDAPDQPLYAWIIGSEAPPPEHDTPVLHAVQAFTTTVYAAGPHVGGG